VEIRSQGDFYGHDNQASGQAIGRVDLDRAGDAAGFCSAEDSQRGATGAAESAADVCAVEPAQRPASGSLRVGYVLCGGGASEESAAASGEVPVVVLEQKAEDEK